MAGAPIPCSQSSRDAGEPLWGTANETVSRWVMVEDTQPWGPKVPAQARGLPEAARARLLALDADPHTRVQLIRRPRAGSGADPGTGPDTDSGADAGGINVYVARVDEHGGALFHARFADSTALERLDPDLLVTQAPRVPDPVFFVCTHGTRDACCARHGMPVYTELAEHRPTRTWQCSHLGGHRFAPTLLVLPHGAVYGRLPVAHIVALADAADAGRLHDPRHLRGRSCYGAVVQAAEAMLRDTTKELAIGAVRLRDASELGDGRFEVALACAGVDHVLHLQRETLPVPVYGSCGDDTPQPAVRFRRLDPRPAGG